MVIKKLIVTLMAVLIVVSICACRSGDNGTSSSETLSQEQPQMNYEDCYYWNGDMIESLSARGRIQTKLVIPRHCRGFEGVLLSTTDSILEEVVFEGGYDIDIGTQFAYQPLLKTIQLPDEITIIPQMAFIGCIALEDIAIPSSVTTISAYAFEEGVIKSVTFQGQSLIEIGEKAFYACPISSIIFPDSVEVIGKSAFENCNNLSQVTLPKSLRKIGDQAFMNAGLTDLYVPAEVELESVGFTCFNNNDYFITVHITEGSWMDLNFDQVFDNTFEKTYQ